MPHPQRTARPGRQGRRFDYPEDPHSSPAHTREMTVDQQKGHHGDAEAYGHNQSCGPWCDCRNESPPSTTTHYAVAQLLRLESRNRTVAAISCTGPRRPSGTRSRSRLPSEPVPPCVRGLLISPVLAENSSSLVGGLHRTSQSSAAVARTSALALSMRHDDRSCCYDWPTLV
ncbi:hypothetical protein SMALB_2228 [Streptomyces malaysiensis]|uniref:Uncharacterized protein n=1 Tax=Streptomyces malaysiensis TaxID=92644 RepID=A0A7X5X1S6_STRMQ|nr:hypothetical protein [Streptomyces malaysiensis]